MNTSLLFFTVVATAVAAAPQFPTDWSADVSAAAVINQGAQPQGDLLCCAKDENCQVQIQYQDAQQWFDYSHNRTRAGDVIYLYDEQKEVEVDAGMNCVAYCPLYDTISPFPTIPDDAKDLGPITLPDGTQAEHYQWQDIILKVVVMDTVDFYTTTDSAGNLVPVYQYENLTPFGQPSVGYFNSTFSNFVGGPQDKSKFAVVGLDSCPEASNCQEDKRQIARRLTRNLETWARSYQAMNLDAAKIEK